MFGIFRFIILLCLLNCVRAKEALVVLHSGEQFPGELQTAQGSKIRLKSGLFAQPVDLESAGVERISYPAVGAFTPGAAIVTLTNQDVCSGNIVKMTPSHVKLATNWDNTLSIDLKHVAHIAFAPQKVYYNNLTASVQNWRSDNQVALPACRDGAWHMFPSVTTAMRSDISLPETFHIHFTLVHSNNFNFRLSFETRDYLGIFISHGRAQLTRYTTNSSQVSDSAIWDTKSSVAQDDTFYQTKVDLYADNKKGTYYLFINDAPVLAKEELDLFNDQNATPKQTNVVQVKNEQQSLFINCYDYRGLQVSDFNVYDWHGGLINTAAATATEGDSDTVLLMNGDMLKGKITAEGNDALRVQSEHYSVTVPAARIQKIHKANAILNHAKSPASNVTLALTDKSSISVRLNEVKNNRLSAHSPVLGDITVPVEAIQTLQFPVRSQAAQ